MHSWGDGWLYWKDLQRAERILYFWGNRIGRIGGQMKEKWGELRWYANIAKPLQLHDIVKHGHVAFRWSADEHFFMCWLNNLSKMYMPLISLPFFKYQMFMYGFAYHRACKKYPHIKEEILMCTDHTELLFKSEKEFYDSNYGKRNE